MIFMEELSHVLTKDFVSCVHVRCYSFTAAHFHLAASISHFFTAAMKSVSCFSFNKIRLPSSFSVIGVPVVWTDGRSGGRAGGRCAVT